MNKDYMLNVNWKDGRRNNHKIGILAQIDEDFYLLIKGKDKEANDNGFVGIPGFKSDKIYKSKEMFDFFKKRVLRTPDINYCEELIKTEAISMIDSFSISEMPEEEANEKKLELLEAYKLQEQLKKVENIKE